MKALTYERANSLIDAEAASAKPGAKLIAGELICSILMKLRARGRAISSISIDFR